MNTHAQKKASTGNKREPISRKKRFEIFARDNFTCQYCGQKAPQVVLHVDHIHPVSKGGTNDPSNLVTACSSCNTGKGASEIVAAPVAEDRLSESVLDDIKSRCNGKCERCGKETDNLIVYSSVPSIALSKSKSGYIYGLCDDCYDYGLQWVNHISSELSSLFAFGFNGELKVFDKELINFIMYIQGLHPDVATNVLKLATSSISIVNDAVELEQDYLEVD